MKISLIASLPCLATVADARFKWGECPSDLSFVKLDQERFEGMWYEIQRDSYSPYTIGAECVTQNYRQR